MAFFISEAQPILDNRSKIQIINKQKHVTNSCCDTTQHGIIKRKTQTNYVKLYNLDEIITRNTLSL